MVIRKSLPVSSIRVKKFMGTAQFSSSVRARLNVQKHKYCAEHRVVVEGVAKVHVDHVFQDNDSVYIPKGAVHCLANETKLPLHLVEVQSGSYLGEDDIERLDDIYGRC